MRTQPQKARLQEIGTELLNHAHASHVIKHIVTNAIGSYPSRFLGHGEDGEGNPLRLTLIPIRQCSLVC